MSHNTLHREWSVLSFCARLPRSGCGLLSCWPIETKRKDGYATFGDGRSGVGSGEIYAHRIVATLIWGRIPEGHEVDHLCFRRNCVNPFHLKVRTLAENRQRHAPRPPRVHCRRAGHLLAEVGLTSQGRCKACQQASMAAYHAAHRDDQNAKRAARRSLESVAS